MNYSNYRSSGKRKRISAFYIVFAVCLLAVGFATWYSAHRVRSATRTDYESDLPKEENSYVSSDPAESEIVGITVSDEPYSEPTAPSQSEEKTEKQELMFAFPVKGEVVKSYSDTQLQYSETYGDMRLHRGMDIACKEGTSVSAAASGTVTAVEESAEFGTVVTIEHGNGITTRYAGIKDVKVMAGDNVAAGDILGTVGEIPGECAEASHLHFEVLQNGKPSDPALLFKTE